jgi:hypothetical protein
VDTHIPGGLPKEAEDIPALQVDDVSPLAEVVVSGKFKHAYELKLGYIILPTFIAKLPSGHFLFTHIVIVSIVGLPVAVVCCINERTTELSCEGIIPDDSKLFKIGSWIEYVTVLYAESQVVDDAVVVEVIGNAGDGADILYILYIYKIKLN